MLPPLEKLDVPVEHAFLRSALLALWFVPLRYEAVYYRVLEHLWLFSPQPREVGTITAYFQSVLPPRDFPHFEAHLKDMLTSLGHPGHSSEGSLIPGACSISGEKPDSISDGPRPFGAS